MEDKREFYSQDSEDEVYYTPPTSPGFLTPLIEQEADNELDFALFING